jgi:hypothetical protein
VPTWRSFSTTPPRGRDEWPANGTSLRSWVEALEILDLARFKKKPPAPEPQLV